MQPQSSRYEVTWLIRRLFRAMAQVADGYLNSHGLSAADRAVLEFLYPDEALSVPEIAKRYQVSRQHVQVTVNALLQDGFLATRPNPRHKRSPLIALTRVGHEMFQRIRRIESDHVSAMFADVPDHDVEITRRTLEAIYFRNLKAGERHETRDA
jgi:DNA-binding MarR family transcriptional regulator